MLAYCPSLWAAVRPLAFFYLFLFIHSEKSEYAREPEPVQIAGSSVEFIHELT